ncbi:MAG: hypothetical protein RO469_13500 [Thermincola sp.]|jgi:hypothetical protein|nr:hypothetical protein [Thermincola sp.]MDT3703727.1 hypothetical protein [Thermincola sp.]
MNFLYEMYLATDDTAYLENADSIKLAVKDTVYNWNKPDGDLHYARLLDGTFGKQDYPTLTLKDLRYSQYLIKKTTGQDDIDFWRLISWKEQYNKNHGIPLY